MLKRLRIRHFQNHRNTIIEFHPGVNIITGSSDNGKSAILRAIRWVLDNRPSGFSFRSINAPDSESTSVSCQFSGGTVVRKRGNKKNIYVVGGEEFAALRSEVPPEVREITQIEPHQYQSQHEGVFLLSESPGEVAKRLNQLVGLNTDEIFRRVSQLRNDTNGKLNSCVARIEECDTELERFANLDRIESEIHRLEKIEQKKEKLVNQIQTIKFGIQEVQRVEAKITPLRNKIAQWKSIIRRYGKKVQELEQGAKQEKQLYSILESIGTLSEKIRIANKRLEGMVEVKKLIALAETAKKASIDYFRVEGVHGAIANLQSKLETNVGKIEHLRKQQTTMHREMKVCPLCDKPFNGR